MDPLIRGEPARSNLRKLVEPLAQHRMIGDRHRDLYRSVRIRALSAGFPAGRRGVTRWLPEHLSP